MPLIYFVVPETYKAAPLEHFIAWSAWLMMILAALPQYYEVREDDQFLCLRWRRRLISYVTVAELVDVRNRKGIGTFRAEVNLVRVTTTTGETYSFGVEEKDRFLNEVLKRCPQLRLKRVTSVRDLWTHADVKPGSIGFDAVVPAHGVVMLRVKGR